MLSYVLYALYLMFKALAAATAVTVCCLGNADPALATPGRNEVNQRDYYNYLLDHFETVDYQRIISSCGLGRSGNRVGMSFYDHMTRDGFRDETERTYYSAVFTLMRRDCPSVW